MDDKDFYQKFNSDAPKSNTFKSSIVLPFISGILGTTFVLGLAFGVPSIKTSLLGTTSSPSNISENSIQASNTGVVDYVSLNKYSDTAVFAASKVLPSIVGITVEYTVTSNFMQSFSQLASAEGSGIIISSDGYILTNNHIINSSDSSSYYEVSEATKVYVYLHNDETP